MEEKEKETIEETQKPFFLGKVSTQTEECAVESESGEPFTQLELLIKIANDLEDIKSQLV